MLRNFLDLINLASSWTACRASASRYAWSVLMVRARDKAVLGTWLVRRGERQLHSRLRRTLTAKHPCDRMHRVPFWLADRLCLLGFVGWVL